MSRLRIHGGRRIAGVYAPVGNKNAALPMLAACLLTDDPVRLHNVPAIEDVRVMLRILEGIGVAVDVEGPSVRLCAAGLKDPSPDPGLCRLIRASILLAGPLAARHDRVQLPPPGGDGIGRRRLDPHISGLRELGIDVRIGPVFELARTRLHGAEVLLDEASVTATENILMAAAVADGTTTVFPAACEPHVQDLCGLLSAMGAKVEGIGTNRLVVHGARRLGGAEYTVGHDYVDMGSFLIAAAVTRGEMTVSGVGDGLSTQVLRRSLQKLGIVWELRDRDLVLDADPDLAVREDLGSAMPKIEDGVWPAFPSDLMSVAIVAATQARGSVLFFEKLFESRMYFVDRLIEMGAQIVPCDPHRIVVQGPRRLRGIHMTSPDIRAGMAMLIAALCAEGESTIEHAQMIDRGYERVDERLRAMGAEILRDG